MRYVWPEQPWSYDCHTLGHTWPPLEWFDRSMGVVRARRFPLWRRLLNAPETCSRCGVRRYYR